MTGTAPRASHLNWGRHSCPQVGPDHLTRDPNGGPPQGTAGRPRQSRSSRMVPADAPRRRTRNFDHSKRTRRVEDLPVRAISCFCVRKGRHRRGATSALMRAALHQNLTFATIPATQAGETHLAVAAPGCLAASEVRVHVCGEGHSMTPPPSGGPGPQVTEQTDLDLDGAPLNELRLLWPATALIVARSCLRCRSTAGTRESARLTIRSTCSCSYAP